MAKSKAALLHNAGFYLSNQVHLPGNLADLVPTIDAQHDDFSRSSITASRRSAIVLDGSPIGDCSVADLDAFGACPEPPQAPRSIEDVYIHLQKLCMPSAQAAAGDELRDALGLVDLGQLAENLHKLDGQAPDVVKALLSLDVATARRLLAASSPSLIEFVDRSQIIARMSAIRFVYAMRMAAMDAGTRLRRPTGFAAVDDIGDGCAPRYGPLIAEAERELGVVMSVLSAYDRGLTNLSSLGLRDRRFIDSTDLEQRARTQLIIWRRQHGRKLEALLRDQLKYVRKCLEKLGTGLGNARRLLPPNLRIANDVDAPPLPVVYNIVRIVVAVLLDVERGDHVRGRPKTIIQPRGLNAILSWAKQPDDTRGLCPFPSLHPDLRPYNDDVFAMLRFALIHDDNMFSKGAVETVCCGGKTIRLTSQAARIRMGLAPLSYLTLKGHFEQGQGHTDVSKAAEPGARTVTRFSAPMRRALQPWLDWVIGGL